MKQPSDPRLETRVAAPEGRLPPVWMWLSVSAGLLAFAGSLLSLFQPAAVYGRETDELISAALAQDVVNAFLVSPLLVILAVLARRGSIMSWLALMGFLGFTVYNYSIYAFSIQFGPLFLAWVAVLGLSAFALAGALANAVPEVARLICRSFLSIGMGKRVPDWLSGTRFLWVPEGSLDAWSACHRRRRGQTDMRGLATAGRSVRLERIAGLAMSGVAVSGCP